MKGKSAHADGHKHGASRAGDSEHHVEMMTSMPMGTRKRWIHAANLAIGVWLLTSPVTLGYQVSALLSSDIASGVLVMLLSLIAAANDPPWARWGICIVGIWLLFEPLVFWPPGSAAYANDTLIGALLIAFSILIPGMPGMMMPGPETPPGWSYNPSSWLQRGPIIALGFLGFFISRYMAAYQLGYIHSAWDPFFGNGTERILTSKVSQAWPISDAGLGAVTYLL